jgi:PHS family inorganic phosphate transporter-like MFS transporter
LATWLVNFFSDGSQILWVVRGCVGVYFMLKLTIIINQYMIDGVELMVMIIATFGQALAGQAPAVSVLGVIIVWRFIVSATNPQNVRASTICP